MNDLEFATALILRRFARKDQFPPHLEFLRHVGFVELKPPGTEEPSAVLNNDLENFSAPSNTDGSCINDFPGE